MGPALPAGQSNGCFFALSGVSFQMFVTRFGANAHRILGRDNVSDACLRLRDIIKLLQRANMARDHSWIRTQMSAECFKINAHLAQFVSKHRK